MEHPRSRRRVVAAPRLLPPTLLVGALLCLPLAAFPAAGTAETAPDPASHRPEVADLTIELVQRRAPFTVGFSLSVRDDQGDLGERPTTLAVLVCGRRTAESAADGVVVRDESGDGTAVRVGSGFLGSGRAPKGVCTLKVAVRDLGGRRSEWLTTEVRFE
jgi:hypothetical protein